jgi:alpha-glucosidase
MSAQRDDSASILSLYRALLSLRRTHSALSLGSFRLLGVQDEVLVYERDLHGERILVCLNFGSREQKVSIADAFAGASIQVSTHLDRTGPLSNPVLRPHEGIVLRIDR